MGIFITGFCVVGVVVAAIWLLAIIAASIRDLIEGVGLARFFLILGIFAGCVVVGLGVLYGVGWLAIHLGLPSA